MKKQFLVKQAIFACYFVGITGCSANQSQNKCTGDDTFVVPGSNDQPNEDGNNSDTEPIEVGSGPCRHVNKNNITCNCPAFEPEGNEVTVYSNCADCGHSKRDHACDE